MPSPQNTIHNTQYTPYTLRNSQYTIDNTQYTIHNTQHARHSIHNRQYTIHNTHLEEARHSHRGDPPRSGKCGARQDLPRGYWPYSPGTGGARLALFRFNSSVQGQFGTEPFQASAVQPNMIPKLSQHDSQTMPKLSQNDSTIKPIWSKRFQNETCPKMIQTWPHNYPNMIPKLS